MASLKSDKQDESMNSEVATRRVRRTVDPGLLFSFIYFDRLHSGYLIDKDVEGLIHCLGLSLSRSQIRRLISKVVTVSSSRSGNPASVHYRSLTDKEVRVKYLTVYLFVRFSF